MKLFKKLFSEIRLSRIFLRPKISLIALFVILGIGIPFQNCSQGIYSAQSSGAKNSTLAANVSLAAACGSANNIPQYNIPSTQTALCTQGGPSSVIAGNNIWSWSCTGVAGDIVNCSSVVKIDGACGTEQGLNVNAAPLGLAANAYCASGTSTSVAGAGPFTWTCIGANGGLTANCSTNLIVNGSCGASNNGNFLSAPTLNLCASGNASSVSPASPYQWTCGGVNSGTSATCSANQTVNGACGSANGVTTLTAPLAANLCNSGAATTPTSSSGGWSWQCNGAFGGINASCTDLLTVNAACGVPVGSNVAAQPTTLCQAGTFIGTVTGTEPMQWGCQGLNGGSAATCSAFLTVNGTCGSAATTPTTTAPNTNLCNAGNPTSVVNSTSSFSWSCMGLGGGTTATCSIAAGTPAQCGTANATMVTSSPTTNLCATSFPASSVAGSGPWHWTCGGLNGGASAGCLAQSGNAASSCTPGESSSCNNWTGTAGTQTCNTDGQTWTACAGLTCAATYINNYGTCVGPTKIPTCLAGGAWNGSCCFYAAYGTCGCGGLTTDANCNYNVACTAGQTVSCSERHGSGTQTCASGSGPSAYGACKLTSCAAGYILTSGGSCVKPACSVSDSVPSTIANSISETEIRTILSNLPGAYVWHSGSDTTNGVATNISAVYNGFVTSASGGYAWQPMPTPMLAAGATASTITSRVFYLTNSATAAPGSPGVVTYCQTPALVLTVTPN